MESVRTEDRERVRSRMVVRGWRALKKAILKVPRWLCGNTKPKRKRNADVREVSDVCDLPATPVEDRGDDGLAIATPPVRDSSDGATAEDDRGDAENGLAATVAADSRPIHVPSYHALVQRGYKVHKTVGEGGFGSILLARSSRHHGQLMAVKVVEKLLDGRANFNLKWTADNEKRFAEQFDHPYLNVYYELIESSKRLYMVMEYYRDGTLWDYYYEVDHTPESVAYKWFAELCSALDYVHERDYCHRDVKLENVLLDRKRHIRLSDFGLCGPASATMLNRTVCGTPPYMLPEMLSDAPYHGQLADVWAAGVLLYSLVAGRSPFDPEDQSSTDADSDDANLVDQVLECQSQGYAFDEEESERLSSECQSFFENIFVDEAARMSVKQLVQCEWMQKGARQADR